MSARSGSRHTRVGVALATLTLVGCGGRYDSTVTGVVSVDGKPLNVGLVTFDPQESGSSAYGNIGADGTYTLYTGRQEGLASGEYGVSVTAYEPSDAPGPQGGPPPMGKSLIAERYRSPSTSGIKLNVEPGDNRLDLKLTAAAR
jgi:hypothetical protein